MKHLLLIFTLIMLSLTSADAQKSVYWVHGLNEDNTFWQRYQDNITPVQGLTTDWSSGQRLTYIANQENQYLTSQGSTNSKYIVVGHSAGGLVARKMQKTNGNIAGIITIGTPNYGSAAVKTVQDRTYHNIITKLDDKIEDCLSLDPISAAIVNIVNHSWVLPELIKVADEQIVEFADLTDATVKDMHPTSSFITDLNSENIDVPIITIAGNETRWPALRIFSSSQNADSIASLTNTDNNPYDDDYMQFMYDLQSACKTIKLSLGTISLTSVIIGVFSANPWLVGAGVAGILLATAVNSLENYITIGMHNDYAQMIGSGKIITGEFCYEACPVDTDVPPTTIGEIEQGGTQGSVGNVYFKPPGHGQVYPAEDCFTVCKPTVQVYSTKNHDGLINVIEAHLKTNKGESVQNITIENVNHLAMNANKDIQDRLESIFYQEDAYGNRIYLYPDTFYLGVRPY